MKLRSLKLFSGAATAALLGYASTAVAGEAPADGTLPELVVTAERRTESLQRVPIAATVLDAAQLVRQGVNRVEDLQRVAPSIAINTYNRSTFINIRGVGIAQSAPSSTPGVAMYVNGAFIPHEFTISGAFYDIGSIEVLRGPQGTLTGQNSTGGAIYIRTPAPQYNQFSASLDQTVGSYEWYRTIGAVNLPLINDRLALRVSATHEERDSFTTNIGGPSQPGNLNFEGVRADLGFEPTARLSGNLRVEYFKNDNDYVAIKNRNDLVTKDPFVIEEDAISSYLSEGQRGDLELRYDIGGAQLRLLSSLQQSVNRDIADGDRTATARPRPPTSNVGRLGYTKTAIETQTHEVNLISADDGALRWVLGGFFLDEDVDTTLLRWHFQTVRPIGPATNNITLSIHNRTRSAFGQATWRASDKLELLAGLRYSSDRQQFKRIIPAAATGVQKSEQVTGKAAINWFATDDAMLYASVARGYKAGGVNLGVTDPNYGPETNTVVEGGAKLTLLEGHLRLNGDVYWSEYENFQLSSLTPARSPVTQNVPKSRTYGAELEAEGVWGAFGFNFGAAYLRAKLTTDVNLLDNTVSPSVLRLVPSGTRMPFAPRWTLNAGAEYRVQTSIGTFTPRLQWAYLASQWSATFQNSSSFVPSRSIVDARLTYEPAEQWRVEAAVTNLFDETYVASQLFNTSSADGGSLYGAPRQYSVRVIYRFN